MTNSAADPGTRRTPHRRTGQTMTFPAKYPQLNDTQLTERARTVLIRVVRVAFPHSRLPDGPYERTADIILKEAAASNWFRVSLTQGLGSLDSLAGGDFCSLDDDRAYKVLKSIEGTDFFGFIRRHHGAQPVRRPGGVGGSRLRGPVLRPGRVPQPRLRRPGLAARATHHRVRRTGDVRADLARARAAPPTATLASTPASAADGEIQGNLKATLSTQQDPREGARPADANSAKAGV